MPLFLLGRTREIATAADVTKGMRRFAFCLSPDCG